MPESEPKVNFWLSRLSEIIDRRPSKIPRAKPRNWGDTRPRPNLYKLSAKVPSKRLWVDAKILKKASGPKFLVRETFSSGRRKLWSLKRSGFAAKSLATVKV